MVEIIILIATALVFVGIGAYALYYRSIKVYPEGLQIESKYEGFRALVIVDKTIPETNGMLHFKGDPIPKEKLAKGCAVAMESLDFVAKQYGPEELKSPKKLKECIFLFLDDEAYDKFAAEHNALNSNGFATSVSVRKMGGKTMYCCVGRAQFMRAAMETGLLVVHEYTHCYSSYIGLGYDPYHEIWDFVTTKGKNVNAVTMDRVTSIMKNEV